MQVLQCCRACSDHLTSSACLKVQSAPGTSMQNNAGAAELQSMSRPVSASPRRGEAGAVEASSQERSSKSKRCCLLNIQFYI